MENKKSRSLGTLLQVTKRALNAQVSSLKELIEPSFSLLNYLIATGPTLDGNTFYIRDSLLECMAIWLKWFT